MWTPFCCAHFKKNHVSNCFESCIYCIFFKQEHWNIINKNRHHLLKPFKSDLKVRRQAVAIHSSLLESRNFDGNEGMREAVQRVQDLEKQLLGTIDIFCLWKGDVGKEKGKTSRFPVDFGTESNEVCNLVKDWSFFFWIVSTVVTVCCTWKKGNGLRMNRRVE